MWTSLRDISSTEKSFMKGKAFIDTNILVYYISSDKNKKEIARGIILIIASALENECEVLYSEDLQHGQVIDDKLRIVNPFVI